MRLLFMIDSLGPGGAQRQIVELACGMQRRGHEVHLFYYYPGIDFYRMAIERSGVRLHTYDRERGSLLGLIRTLHSLFQVSKFDVVIAFLDRPNLLAEVVKIFSRDATLVVSERSSFTREIGAVIPLVRRLMHLVADHVVSNSRTHGEWLRSWPWLRSKVSIIYNGVNVEAFSAPLDHVPLRGDNTPLLGIGRIGPEKGIDTIIEGLDVFSRRAGYVPRVLWAGTRDLSPSGRKYWSRLECLLAARPHVAERWAWLGQREDIASLLWEADALIHASHFEGLPNAICEALVAGCPIIASNVCDHPFLVQEGERGFLFEAGDPAGFSDALMRLCALDEPRYLTLVRNARSYGERHLGLDRMLDEYEDLFRRVGREG